MRGRLLARCLPVLSTTILLAHGRVLAQETSLPAGLEPVPEVALDTVEPAVRQQLEEQRRQLERLLERDDLTAEQRASIYGETGQLYLLYDLAPAAEACLRNAAALSPDGGFRWHYLLGGLYQLDNRLDLAEAAFRRALADSPGDGSSLMRLAEVLQRRQRLEEAEDLYRRAQGVPGFEAAAQFGRGRLATARGDHRAAVEHFQRALELQPGASLVHYHLGLAHRELGDEEAMRRHLEQRGDNEVRFPDPLALELQGKATGVGALLSLGRMSLAVDALEEAERRFRRAVELDPKSSAAQRSLASALQKQGRIEEALERYELAVELAPEEAGLRSFLGQLLTDLVRRGEIEESEVQEVLGRAVEHLLLVLDQAPDFTGAWVELAGAHELIGNYGSAADAVARALELDVGSASLRNYRARLLLAAGEVDDARVELERSSLIEAPAERYEVARIWEALGEADRSLQLLRQLTEPEIDAPLRALAWFRLGNLESAQGQLEAALTSYRSALELDPSMGEAHFNLATLLGRLGRYGEAAEAARRAGELQPENAAPRLSEAMALVLAAEEAAARRRLEEALERFPSHVGLGHLLAQLLVAASDETVRDGMTGLDLAIRLYQAFPTPEHASTVAMAFAEVGRFDRAIEWQELLIGSLEKAGSGQALERARGRLEQYQLLLPVRAPWNER